VKLELTRGEIDADARRRRRRNVPPEVIFEVDERAPRRHTNRVGATPAGRPESSSLGRFPWGAVVGDSGAAVSKVIEGDTARVAAPRGRLGGRRVGHQAIDRSVVGG
jgi:hypothetical protein